MTLSTLFQKCVDNEFIHVENSADYAIERHGSTLYIFFEASDGAEDWKNNLDFPAKAYKKREDGIWFAHRGFLKVWKSLEVYISPHINDNRVKRITISGYSHGAAIAALCYEYAWYNRPELQSSLLGFGFGCPRVFWGIHCKNIEARWSGFTVIRNIDDIVTHLPPAIFGFVHVGNMLKIGERGKYSAVDAHRPENILKELYAYEAKHISVGRTVYAKSSHGMLVP